MKNSGIYIHIPFCLRKCPYCDFYSVAEAQHGKAETDAMRGSFVKALCREIEAAGKKYGKGARAEDQRHGDTIYFGGGTPSLLEPDELGAILNVVRENFQLADEAEISMECNPATASREKLAAFRTLGINRLSIGAQSFDDEVLKILGRLHNSDDTIRTVEEARKAGFENISLDLMFAIPGQTEKKWEETVKQTLALRPQHISLYSLEFMEGTAFTARLEKGEIRETEAEADRSMYEKALDEFKCHGYVQYEISNVALGREHICRHNLKYWSLEEYLGFGPSAHSYMTGENGKGVRFNNVSSLEKYMEGWGMEGCAADGMPAVESITENSAADDVCEYIFTGLRKTDGIDLGDFRRRFKKSLWDFYGEDVHREFEEYVTAGFAAEEDDNIRLTVKGMNVSNRIMALFV